MMRIMAATAGILLAVFCLAACDKKSVLEGKVSDGKGKPVAGVKVVAKQVKPFKGYEQFETTTGSDGVFKFGKLFPSSAYELAVDQDGATKYESVTIESGPEGQTITLPEPITVRFQFSKDGATAIDTKTGLMWTVNANLSGSRMSWDDAMDWVLGLEIGGHKDWRLPTAEELKAFLTSGKGKSVEYFRSIGFTNVPGFDFMPHYWSSSNGDNDITALVVFINGQGPIQHYKKDGQDFPKRNNYVWPVRSGQ